MKALQYFGRSTCINQESHLGSSGGLAKAPYAAVKNFQLFENCITKKELAQHFKVSQGLINKLMTEECLPHIKIGRAVRFRLNDVYTWFERKGNKL